MSTHTAKTKKRRKKKIEAEMYIITMSAQHHMLLGSIMKMSLKERVERANNACATAVLAGGGGYKLLLIKTFFQNRCLHFWT